MKMSESDAAEIELFKLYLRARARWDNEHDELPDFAPISELERVRWEKKRAQAHVEIYKQIYGDAMKQAKKAINNPLTP